MPSITNPTLPTRTLQEAAAGGKKPGGIGGVSPKISQELQIGFKHLNFARFIGALLHPSHFAICLADFFSPNCSPNFPALKPISPDVHPMVSGLSRFLCTFSLFHRRLRAEFATDAKSSSGPSRRAISARSWALGDRQTGATTGDAGRDGHFTPSGPITSTFKDQAQQLHRNFAKIWVAFADVLQPESSAARVFGRIMLYLCVCVCRISVNVTWFSKPTLREIKTSRLFHSCPMKTYTGSYQNSSQLAPLKIFGPISKLKMNEFCGQ